MMRSIRLQQLFVVVLLVVAIATMIYQFPRQATGPLRTEKITIDALPAGLGRGFPLVALDQSDNRATGIAVGDQAPDFQLLLEDGRYIQFADLAGRPVLINFWATWCGPCRLEMPELVAEANRNEALIVVAVNVQEELAQLEGFVADFQMTMPVVRDTMGDLRDLYGVRGMPTSVFIDREGKIATVWTGILTPKALQERLAEIQ